MVICFYVVLYVIIPEKMAVFWWGFWAECEGLIIIIVKADAIFRAFGTFFQRYRARDAAKRASNSKCNAACKTRKTKVQDRNGFRASSSTTSYVRREQECDVIPLNDGKTPECCSLLLVIYQKFPNYQNTPVQCTSQGQNTNVLHMFM